MSDRFAIVTFSERAHPELMQPPGIISHYRVSAKLGAGGMGEVYRATDTKLGREVAIKVLPTSFAADKERLARFGREAQVLASLNHPNIAAIFALEDSGEAKALVLELVEGETLAERLRRGPLPLEEAMEVCSQVAAALEAAHEKGIIHRDLKPANVKLTPDGKAKVLDFGLAKLMEESNAKGPSAALENSPTITADCTTPGTILGTAAYMSPEQAKGKLLDKRTDIWSFGCLLYECLAGQRVFGGETVTDSLGAVLHKEPDWSALPAATPPSVQLLLRKCLAKDRQHRLHDIADARVDLEQALQDPGTSSISLASAAVAAEGRRQGKRKWLTAMAWALSLGTVAFVLYSHRSPAIGNRPPAVLQTYALNLHAEAPLSTAAPLGSSITIAPDCSKIVYTGTKDGISQLYWKGINDPEFKPIPDAAKAFPPAVFSPESDRVAFWTQDFDLKVFSFAGGLPQKIRSLGTVTCGAQWGPGNRLVYANADGIYSIAVNEGATPQLLVSPAKEHGEIALTHPQFLPGANGIILFTAINTNTEVSLQSFDLSTKARRTLEFKGSINPVFYPPTGHLLYGRDDVLWARSFDPSRLEFAGNEIPLVNDLGRDWAALSHQFTIARNGTFLYARGHQAQPRYQLIWVKGQESPEVLPLDPGRYSFPRLAPDGRSLLLGGPSSKQFLVSLPKCVPVELGTGGQNTHAFAYDGTHAFLTRRVDTNRVVLRVRTDGTGQPEEIYRAGTDEQAADLSGDGKYLALIRQAGADQADIWIKELGSSDPVQPFATARANEVSPKFSPDGRWLAYTANMTDRYEVYVKKVRAGGLPLQVSKKGGSNPVWSRDGSTLYYRNANGIMSAKAKLGDSLEFETPSVFATGRFVYSGVNAPANYDVFADKDGDRLLMLRSVDQDPEPQLATQVTVMVHFDDYLREQQAAQAKPPGKL